MKRNDLQRDSNCNNKKRHLDVPEPYVKLKLDEKRKLVWNTEFPNCTNIAQKYEMLCLIGKGSYGIVYKVREKGTSNYVALKKVLLNGDQSGIPLSAIREIRILQQLKHDNVIEFLEVCKAKIPNQDGLATFYIALEYCEFSLEAMLKEKRLELTLGAKKTLLKHLLSGLNFVHQNSILHRDIKTANLLISKTGTLKIADFGLARAVHKGSDSPNVQQVFSGCVVTLWYRAPELLLGERSYTSAIDLWSAGCVMAELWTRTALMSGSSEKEQLFLILKLCGSISEENWPTVSKLPLYAEMELPKHCKRRLKAVLGQTFNDENALNLLENLLTLDPEKRIDANNALNNNFFREEPLPESLKPYLATYRKIQLQPKIITQTEKYSGYVDHIF